MKPYWSHPEAAAYGIVVKEQWRSSSAEEKGKWDSQAENEAGDVELTRRSLPREFILHFKAFAKAPIGDAKMMLFYGFRDAQNGELLVGTQVLPSLTMTAH
ncbi:hypothetical protein FB451DRAFT_1179111 [Mycena latifolia]|nr:hypothetical protein FB451DRAFT_1179111 [Mycena latifolia]